MIQQQAEIHLLDGAGITHSLKQNAKRKFTDVNKYMSWFVNNAIFY